MLIKLNTAGCLGYQSLTNSKTMILKPGINEMSDKDWAKMKDHQKFKKMLEDGDMEVVKKDNEKSKSGGEVASNLAEMKASDATKVVEQTLDKELLESWLEGEERVTVQRALDKQLKKLEYTKEELDG